MDILIWITIHNKPGSTNHHTSTDLFTVSSGLQLCYMQGHKRCSLVIRHLLHFYIGIRYHFHVNRGSSCVCILCIIHMDRMDAMYYTTGVELWRAALSDHIIANDFAGLAEQQNHVKTSRVPSFSLLIFLRDISTTRSKATACTPWGAQQSHPSGHQSRLDKTKSFDNNNRSIREAAKHPLSTMFKPVQTCTPMHLEQQKKS